MLLTMPKAPSPNFSRSLNWCLGNSGTLGKLVHSSSSWEVCGMCRVVKSSPAEKLELLLLDTLWKCCCCRLWVAGEVGGFLEVSGWKFIKHLVLWIGKRLYFEFVLTGQTEKSFCNNDFHKIFHFLSYLISPFLPFPLKSICSYAFCQR